MDSFWRDLIWRQYGAAIDMLDNAVKACPDDLWRTPIWGAPDAKHRAEFWRITFHTLFWLDLYLSGVDEDDFAPPARFTLTASDDPDGQRPARVYAKDELRGYLADLRAKCQTILTTLTEEQARRPVNYPWIGEDVSYAELQVYCLRHVQEHAAQLSLILGLHGVPDEAVDWVPRA